MILDLEGKCNVLTLAITIQICKHSKYTFSKN